MITVEIGSDAGAVAEGQAESEVVDVDDTWAEEGLVPGSDEVAEEIEDVIRRSACKCWV